jgi:hypothetical protein
MNLMSLLRLMGFLVIAWTVLAVGAGMYGFADPAGSTAEFFIPRPALHEIVSLDRVHRPTNARPALFDQSTGRIEPMPLPAQFQWELLTVSPWRSRDGRLEAVGRWVDWSNGDGESLCGLGLFRLPDATVVRRVTLDVLPTSRPCWVPDRPGELLFAAGDGRLYRCRIGDHRAPSARDPGGQTDGGGVSAARTHAVIWHCEEPGAATTFLSDPVWPTDPRFKRLVLVALCSQRRASSGMTYEPSKLWWLKLSTEGDAIVAAGRLIEPEKTDGPSQPSAERSPYIAIGANGQISLFYIARLSGDRGWKLHSSPLELDGATGVPHVRPTIEPRRPLGNELAVVSLAGTADGQSVYAFADNGRIRRLSVPLTTR